MSVAVVNIREMRVFVRHSHMTMPMVMWLVIVPTEIVRMLVVCIMDVLMTVLHRLMYVFVLMVLRQVQPDTPAHQARRQPEWPCCRFAEQCQCHRRTDKRRRRKIGSGASRPQAT